MPSWDDRQYLVFGELRARPARELLARVPLERAERVVDLGCGPGNSTALLRARWPQAALLGVDSSPQMLRAAREALPGVRFEEGDAGQFQAEQPLDVLFANAVLHWLPDHGALFPRLLTQLRAGGALAVQMPRTHDEPSHRWMRELPGWAPRVAGVRPQAPVKSPQFYYDLLAPHARDVDLWQTRYEHVLVDASAIVQWVRGTGLLPFLEALGPQEREAYLRDYTAAIERAYPSRRDGRCLLSFPRLFLVATR